MTRKFRISTGPSRLSTRLSRKAVKWETLVERLLRYTTVDLSYTEFMALDREVQSNYKDAGYFIGGVFNTDQRLLQHMAARCCITLDIDHIDSWDLDAIETCYSEFEYVVHSTIKYCEDTPRLRLVFPLAHDIEPDKYEPLARALADRLGMDCFDDTTFQPARIMFWPVVTVDGEVYKQHNTGRFVDFQEVVDRFYTDWEDFAEWPHSSRVKAIRPSDKQAEDPLTKQGIIGAFNRTFDIHAAIQRFDLPYETTEHENRYRPLDATGPSGAVVYDDVFLYSHHESDAVGQQNVNAWDLVRIHKFGEADPHDGDLDGVPVMQWPSSKQMAALAGSIEAVQHELRTPADEMDEVADTKSPESDTKQAKNVTTDLTFQGLLDDISSIGGDNPKTCNRLKECQAMLPRIAAARLDPDEVDVLAGALRNAYPKPHPSKVALVRSIGVQGKRLTAQLSDGQGGITDIEQDLVDAVLEDHFHTGRTVKRISGCFWTYEKGLWALQDDEPVRGKIVKTVTRLRKERPEDVLQLVAAVGEAKTSTLMNALHSMMCAQLAEREQRDDPLHLMRSYPLPVINCLNCELWFDEEGNMERRKHNPDHFFTVRIDTKYEPDAKCPEWDRFTEMIFSNSSDPEDMTRHLEELGGYVIQMSRWLKTWVLFHGVGDTGKSTVAEVLKLLLGNAFIGMEMSAFGQNNKGAFTDAGLIGKLALVDDDYDKSNALPDGFIKKISEEKSMTTQIKYSTQNLQFISRALPMVLSNHWPVSRDVSDAFRNRALVFPFTYKIIGSHRSDHRRNAMMKELPGIMNRFIGGVKRLRARGAWDVPMDCFEAHQEWEAKSNPTRLFVTECLVIGRAGHVRSTHVWEAYIHWSRDQRSSDSSMRGLSKSEFFERMEAILGERRKYDGYPGWVQVQFADHVQKEMEELGNF